jgi:hypothetical protein
MAAGAAFGWNPGTEEKDFERAFCRVFWGLGNADVLAAVKKAVAERPILSSSRWNRVATYDGDLRARDVKAELAERVPKEGRAALVRASRRSLTLAKGLLRAVLKAKLRASRNLGTLDYLELASQATALRARQGLFLLGVPGGAAARRRLAGELRGASRRLRAQVRGLLQDKMGPASLRRFLTVNFEGEERAVRP